MQTYYSIMVSGGNANRCRRRRADFPHPSRRHDGKTVDGSHRGRDHHQKNREPSSQHRKTATLRLEVIATNPEAIAAKLETIATPPATIASRVTTVTVCAAAIKSSATANSRPSACPCRFLTVTLSAVAFLPRRRGHMHHPRKKPGPKTPRYHTTDNNTLQPCE